MNSHRGAASAVPNLSQLLALVTLFLAAVCHSDAQPSQDSERVNLFPKLSVGQVFRYRIGYRADTHTNTQSNVAAPMAPTGGQTDVQLQLFVQITDLTVAAGKPIARIRTRIVEPDAASPSAPSSANATPPPNTSDAAGAPGKVVEFSLHAGGQITDPEGLDKLSSGEQAAWQEWLSRFAAAATYPERGIKPGDKWKAEEPIASSILAALFWEKESEYVNNAPCGSALAASSSSSQPRGQETCAVILTTATLRQKSNSRDATPEDYKLHDLRTGGIASGKNEIVSYISLKTGVLLRATEDARQTMNATVAKTDGSNRVHYSIEAESHAQVLLIAD